MKRIFTFAIALMSMFAVLQSTSALVYNATVPAGTLACYIAGDFPAPMSWAPSNAGGKMTMVDATHYTIDLPAATASMAYKYCSGPDWAYVEKDADGKELAANRTYAAGVPDVVLKWASIFDPNVLPLPMNVTIDVITPKGTVECYIVGTFNKWAGPTAPVDSIKMLKLVTNPDSTVVFEKTIYTEDANKLAYHFCSGPDWSFEQKTPTGDFKYPEVAPTVTEWKMIYDPSKTGIIKMTVTPPAETQELWIQGSHLGWKMENAKQGVKNENGTFTFSCVGVQSMEYRFYNHPSWSYPEVDSLGAERKNRVATFPADSVLNLTIINWKKTTLTYKVTVPKTTNACYLVGSMNGWSPSATPMTKVDSIHYTIDMPLAKTLDEYKYVCGPDWKYEEVDTAGVSLAKNRTWKDEDVVAKWKEVYASVKEIKTDNYKMYTVNHSLIVEGVKSEVSLFDIAGRIVDSRKTIGTFTSKALKTGLYIVRVDGITRKVAVK